mgnify:CR=1 FL=1
MERKPTSEDSFVMRICIALDMSPQKLAKALEVDYSELRPLLDVERRALVEVDRDEVLWKLHRFVGERAAYLLAVRGELDKKLQTDRKKRLLRTERMKALYDSKK